MSWLDDLTWQRAIAWGIYLGILGAALASMAVSAVFIHKAILQLGTYLHLVSLKLDRLPYSSPAPTSGSLKVELRSGELAAEVAELRAQLAELDDRHEALLDTLGLYPDEDGADLDEGPPTYNGRPVEDVELPDGPVAEGKGDA